MTVCTHQFVFFTTGTSIQLEKEIKGKESVMAIKWTTRSPPFKRQKTTTDNILHSIKATT